MADTTGHLRLRLYLAGASPNSERARANLARWCDELGDERFALELIDVFDDPERALRDRVFLTPTLIVGDGRRRAALVGALSDREVALAALRGPGGGA